MIGFLMQWGEADVRMSYYGDKEEHMREEENCNITPFVQSSPRLNMFNSLSCRPQRC